MNSESHKSDLNSLVSQAREYLKYFQELGVENVEISLPVDTSSKPVTKTESGRTPIKMASAPVTAHRAAPPVAPSQAGSTEQPTDTLFADIAPPVPSLTKSEETFEEIWADIGDCTRCALYQGRTNIVHTEGNRSARLMFVGEAPGADEDDQARPFVGRAGQLLTKIIEAIGLKREEVLIGNINRCRPPGNRPPTSEEAETCKPFLLREIASVQPDVIVVLGNTAMKNLLETRDGITKLRGQFQSYKGIRIMPTFHPAFLLRDPSKKRETWEDLKKVREYLDSHPRKTT